MTIKEAVTILNQQEKIPHPINPEKVLIVKGIIYYDDGTGALWALIRRDAMGFMLFKSNDWKVFYIVD